MKRLVLLVAVALMTGVAVRGVAQENHGTAAPAGAAHDTHAAPDGEPHPQVPHDPEWAGGLVWYIGIAFAAAWVVGVISWRFRREEPVVTDHDAHSHSHEAHEHTPVGLDRHGAQDPHAGHGGAAHH